MICFILWKILLFFGKSSYLCCKFLGDHSKDDVTGVEGIETANPTDANLPVYSLQGQRMGNTLEGLPRGIYIRGGKKILVK